MRIPTIRVLIIEDDPEDAERLQALLKRAPDVHFIVDVEARLSAGIARGERSWPDVVLLDLSLCDTSGMATVHSAREAFPHLPFLVLTGLSDEEIGIQSVQEGAQDYIVKDQIQGPTIVRAIRYAIERKRAAEESAALRQREALQREFVANVSHEFRTPLTAIQASLESLRHWKSMDAEERQRFLAAIGRQTGCLSELVEDLLSMAGLESDRVKVAPREVDLRSGVHECMEDLSALAAAAKVRLSAQDLEGLRVWADPKHLAQALRNIVQNALKYNRPGGSVKISAQTAGSMVQITVKDTGPGIPEQDLPLIFTPFHRTEYATSREIAGTGLGLSIAKKAVEINGGRLWVESEAGKGAIFHFTLPKTGAGGA